jgi:four helix bundle protein
METQAMIAEDLGYLNRNIVASIQEDIGEVERMLKALIKSLEDGS